MSKLGKSDDGRREQEDPYQELAFAIVLMACNDYMDGYRRQLKGKRMLMWQANAESFFKSPRPEFLCGIPGDLILRELRKRVRDGKGPIYK